MTKRKLKHSTQEINQAILDLIESENLGDQETLLKRIHEKGIDITQSTLSRRLKQLEIVKRKGIYKPKAIDMGKTKVPVFKIMLAPPNLMVAHTLPGHAQALAHQLDVLSNNSPLQTEKPKDGGLPEILGTIAGDDTVLIICKNERDLKRVKDRIEAV